MGSSCFTTMRFRTLFFICATLIDATMGSYECDSFSSGSLCSLSPIDNILGLIPNMEDEMKCQAECYQTSECNFFTFEMFIDGTSSCLLFKDCDPATVNSCQEGAECSFSVIGPATPNIVGACCSGFFNASCPMHYLISEEYDVNEEQTCQNYCSENRDCNYYTLFNDVCLLYSACDNTSVCEICFSGPSFPYISKCAASSKPLLLHTLLLGGHFENDTHTKSIELLTPDTSCLPDTQLPEGRSGALAFLLNRVHFCGGSDGGHSGNKATCYSFDSVHNIWQQEPSMVYNKGFGAVSVVGSVAYVTGGSNETEDASATVLSFSDGGSWQEETSMVMTSKRVHHCSAAIGSKLFVIGGKNSDNSDGLSTIQSFDTSNLGNVWQDHQPMNKVRAYFACETGHYEGQRGIFITGGLMGTGFTGNVEFYVADLDRWDHVGYLKHARYYHTMSFFNGNMIVAGGFANDYLESVESFNGSEWEEIYKLSVGRERHAAVSFPPG